MSRTDERGAVAGAEGVVFGVLILLAGSLLVVNAWAALDTRSGLDAAAREYMRAYTQADSPANAVLEGRAALDAVLEGRGMSATAASVTDPDPSLFGPCAPAAVTVSVDVPSMRMPFLDGVGTHTVRVRHVELVDAHKEVIAGAAHDPSRTACAD